MNTNKILAQRALSLIALLAIVAGMLIPASAQTRRRPRARRPAVTRNTTPAVRYYTLRSDQTIRVRMDNELNSKTARVGDRFSTTTVDPVYADGVEVIPAGSKVWGRVTTVRRAQRRSPGTISVSFNAVEMPNGARHTINGSLASLQGGDDVNADNESTVEGRSNEKRDIVFIGGGAATGAIIGAIAGGGKGAGIGAIIGGALGTGGRVFEKEQQAVVKSGTEFGVSLNTSVRLPDYRATTTR
ncbi:MAG TPA: hypothetical protein VGW12_22045 [Pyrinomonadaceae bacterium]|nr:hypothetical protein [Pyrinomonadaceae bacterium]